MIILYLRLKFVFLEFSRNLLAGDTARQLMLVSMQIFGFLRGTAWQHELAAKQHMLFNPVFWVSG